MKKFIKNFLKKNKILVAMYKKFIWMKEIPLKDYINITKLRLILNVKPQYTMVSYAGLSNIYELAMLAEKNKLEGCFVECGTWRGGCAAIMAWAAHRFRSKRKVWFFDSFSGLPEPTEEDGEMARKIFGDERMQGKLITTGACVASRNDIIHLLSSLKLYADNIIIKEGWFQEILPKFKDEIGPIAILRLDGDWYASTKCCLDNLYQNVVLGGYIVIDDYGYWKGCKRAIDEFLMEKKMSTSLLKQIDLGCYYFQKPH